jgi:hypothetical protein
MEPPNSSNKPRTNQQKGQFVNLTKRENLIHAGKFTQVSCEVATRHTRRARRETRGTRKISREEEEEVEIHTVPLSGEEREARSLAKAGPLAIRKGKRAIKLSPKAQAGQPQDWYLESPALIF